MIQTLLGAILLISPILLVYRFDDRRIGFAYVAACMLSLHLFVAIATQALHLFNYWIVAGIHTVVFLGILATGYKTIPRVRIDWVLVYVLFIALIDLYSVHYDYSGNVSVTLSPEYQEASHMKYPYPYFVDEWYAIAFIKQSIEHNMLPFANPLSMTKEYFFNLEFPFHSTLSEVMLLLDLDPLMQYTLVTIFSGMLICLLAYLFLVYNSVGRLPAAIASLSILYVTNGANLPGIWYLTPVIVGIVSMLLSFFFIAAGKKRMVFFMAFLTLLFYPPLLPFSAVALLISSFTEKNSAFKEKVKTLISFAAFAAVAGIVLSLSYLLYQNSVEGLPGYIINTKIVYPAYIEDAIPQFMIWNIVPLHVILLSLIGIIAMGKKRAWLAGVLLLGLAYWLLYSFVTFRILIEYERVIVFTSIMLAIAAGFGLDYLVRFFRGVEALRDGRVLACALIGALLLFLFYSPDYTKGGSWQDLKLSNIKANQTLFPAAPANNYLRPDDLRVFKNITNQSFLSPPWKGTVIGVATGNYPQCTKSGTITIQRLLYSEFMYSDCAKRFEIARSYKIDYVYVPGFDCPYFEPVDKSSEGLYLYRFTG